MINQFETIANRLPDILNRISSATFANQAFDTEKPLPYHDNRLKLIMPLDRNTDITITLTRTRAGKRINYNPDEILKYYRKASITVGPRNSNRCYHVNLRFWKGEIVPLKCDINMTRKIDEKHHAFPQFNKTTVNEAINRALLADCLILAYLALLLVGNMGVPLALIVGVALAWYVRRVYRKITR